MSRTRKKRQPKSKRTRKLSVQDALMTAVTMHRRGLLEEAEGLYLDILRTVPGHPDALHYLGVLAHQLGDSELGVERIKQALDALPDNPDILNNFGNINREIGRLEAAAEAYQKVIALAPNHADTWVNLGIIQRDLKNPDAAIEHLEKALKAKPDHAEAYHNLGNAYTDKKMFDEALDAYKRSMELGPDGNMAPKAIAKIQYNLGRKEEAVKMLRRVLLIDPDDAVAKHLVAAYSEEDVPDRASDEYVEQSFDSFARSFDEVLARLDYKAPELVGAAVIAGLGNAGKSKVVLDIGCGTGLCGPLVQPVATRLIGVDLSQPMLSQAGKRKVYDELVKAELTAFMHEHPASHDVVTCVDTFVYFGNLVDAFTAAYATLRAKGSFFFTVEQHLDEEHAGGYWLRSHGRYSHSREYLQDCLAEAGFSVESIEDVILRNEGSEAVGGFLVSARRS